MSQSSYPIFLVEFELRAGSGSSQARYSSIMPVEAQRKSATGDIAAVVFDCDGVLVDSEPIANRVMSALLAEHGVGLTPLQCMQRFIGLTVDAEAASIRAEFGVDLGDVLERELTLRTIRAFERELRPTAGLREMLGSLKIPNAVASNSRYERVIAALSATGLLSYFSSRIITADRVARPKPAPDVYLAAVHLLGCRAEESIAIEDSPSGIRAARAAGMRAIGYCGAGHAQASRPDQLREAGAERVIAVWEELPEIFGAMFANARPGN